MANELIDRAQKYVSDKFENEYSGHDYFHTLRVFKMATRIAECEEANVEIVQLAALLHDVDDRKISPETYESQANAREFLLSNGVEENTIELICKIIREISFGSNNSTPSTLEGQCVQDADRLDAIGAIGIGRAFAYGGNRGRHMYHPDIKPNLNMTKEEYRVSESIIFTGDTTYWYESGPVNDFLIDGCSFPCTHCGARIRFFGEVEYTEAEKYYHRNVTVRNCYFDQGWVATLNHVDNFVFENNTSNGKMMISANACGELKIDEDVHLHRT